VKFLALMVALAFSALFMPQLAYAGLGGAVEQPDAPSLPQTPEGRGTSNFALPTPAPQRLACVGNCKSAAGRHRQRATGTDAAFRRLRHHWGP
jgi:hypothetical protein